MAVSNPQQSISPQYVPYFQPVLVSALWLMLCSPELRGRLVRQKMARPLILGIGGTTRPGSSSERALSVSLRAAERDGAQVGLIDGPSLMLPLRAALG